jgi:hypothetical protein
MILLEFERHALLQHRDGEFLTWKDFFHPGWNIKDDRLVLMHGYGAAHLFPPSRHLPQLNLYVDHPQVSISSAG